MVAWHARVIWDTEWGRMRECVVVLTCNEWQLGVVKWCGLFSRENQAAMYTVECSPDAVLSRQSFFEHLTHGDRAHRQTKTQGLLNRGTITSPSCSLSLRQSPWGGLRNKKEERGVKKAKIQGESSGGDRDAGLPEGKTTSSWNVLASGSD